MMFGGSGAMKRRTIVLAFAAIVAAACSPSPEKTPESPGAPDPAAVIAPLYQPYLAKGALVGLPDQAPWTPELRKALIDMMARSEAANEPILDFDPIIGAQDYQISGLSVTTEALVPDRSAVVRARFDNLGRAQEVVYDMVWLEGRWRVGNVRGSDWDLRRIAGQAPSN